MQEWLSLGFGMGIGSAILGRTSLFWCIFARLRRENRVCGGDFPFFLQVGSILLNLWCRHSMLHALSGYLAELVYE